MFKMNLLNAEEAGKVNGGAKLPICKTFDVGTCLVDYFPGCGTRDFIICGTRDLIVCGKRDFIIRPCVSSDFIRPCASRDLVIM